MAIDEVDQTVVTQDPAAPVGQGPVRTTHRTTTVDPGRPETARRVVILVFGLIQIAIAARFLLLLLDAREANGLVSALLDIGQVFVAPFEGILRTDNLHSAGSILDIAAIVAFAGWTALEAIVLWALGIFQRAPA